MVTPCHRSTSPTTRGSRRPGTASPARSPTRRTGVAGGPISIWPSTNCADRSACGGSSARQPHRRPPARWRCGWRRAGTASCCTTSCASRCPSGAVRSGAASSASRSFTAGEPSESSGPSRTISKGASRLDAKHSGGNLTRMADQSTQSITIDAPPAQIMAVIADFPAYPEWATSVKSAEVADAGAGGRAKRVRFVLDAGIVKDQYELEYIWTGDERVIMDTALKELKRRVEAGGG